MPSDARRGDLSVQEEMLRLLALQIRLQLPNQAQAILEFDRIGLSNKRIAELLGTTPNTVNVTVQKAKQRSKRAEALSGAADE